MSLTESGLVQVFLKQDDFHFLFQNKILQQIITGQRLNSFHSIVVLLGYLNQMEPFLMVFSSTCFSCCDKAMFLLWKLLLVAPSAAIRKSYIVLISQTALEIGRIFKSLDDLTDPDFSSNTILKFPQVHHLKKDTFNTTYCPSALAAL